MVKRVFWPTLLSIIQLISTIQYVGGSNSISSFSIKSWNWRTSSWVKNAKIYPREDVKLECTTTEFSQVNELHITRADGFPLSENHTMYIQKDTQSLVVILKSVECSLMGIYLCENGRGDKKTVDVGIYDCPPQPCKDQSTNITLYASVNKTKQFSVCVEAFPNVSSLFFFNKMEVRYNRTNELPGVNCTQNKLKEVFSSYNISCTITVIDKMNYTVHNFSIPSAGAQNQIVIFAFRIEEPGPPECPSSINSTNQGQGEVTLSWEPVDNRGGSQPVNYTIFFTTNDTDWQRYNTTEDTQINISNLEIDTVYEFRVASANEYSQVIDEDTICTNTIDVKIDKTTSTPSTPSTTKSDNVAQDVKEVFTPIVIAVIVLAMIVVIAVVVGIIVCVKIRKLHTGISRAASQATMSHHASQRSLATPRGEDVNSRLMDNGDTEATGSHQGSGRYISEQGLTYVTIDHSKTKPKPGKRKSEKVTYATLDPIHTGKYTVLEIPSDNQYENLRVA